MELVGKIQSGKNIPADEDRNYNFTHGVRESLGSLAQNAADSDENDNNPEYELANSVKGDENQVRCIIFKWRVV